MIRILNISELPQEIKTLAEANREDYRNKHRIEKIEDSLISAFEWQNTIQGYGFWDDIYYGYDISPVSR